MAFEMYADQVGKAKQEATQTKIEQKVSAQNDSLPKVMNPYQKEPIMNTALGKKSLPSVATLSVQKTTPTPMFSTNKQVAQGLSVTKPDVTNASSKDLPYILDTAFQGFAGALDGLKNLPLSVATTYSKLIEPHMNNLYSKIIADTTSPILKEAYEKRKPVEEQYKEIMQKDVWFSGLQEDYQKKYKDVEITGQAKFMGDVAAGAAQMIPMITANALSSGSGLLVMFGQVFSSSFEQAVADGAEIENASIYGILQASIEVGTEALFGGIPGMNKGVATAGLRKWAANGVGGISTDSLMKFAKTDAGKALVVKAIDVLGEGAEEYLAEVLGSVTQRVYKDVEGSALKDIYKTAFSKEAGYSALVGAATSGFMQLGNYGAAKGIQQLIQSDQIHNLPRAEQKQLVMDFAENKGIEVEFSYDLEQGVNGWYDVANNKIVVSETTARPYDFVLKHEFTHSMESNPDYIEMRDKSLENSLTEEGYQAEFARIKSLYENRLNKEISDEEIKNEMFANFAGEVLFKDVDSLIRLSRKMPTLFDTIKVELNKYVNKSLGNDLGLYLGKIEQIYEAISRTDNIQDKDLVVPQSEQFSLEQQVPLSDNLTPEQQEFFKDVSPEILDENGNPIKVYHGAKTGGFNEFNYDETNQTGDNYGEAYYFTSDYQQAQNYSYDIKKDPRVADYKKQSDILFDNFAKDPSEENKKAWQDFRKENNLIELIDDENYLTEGSEVKSVYLNLKNPLVVDAEGEYYFKVYDKYFEEARKNNHDGIIVRNVVDNAKGDKPHDVYIAFKKNQIKNTDNFKPTQSNDIRFSIDDTDYQRSRPKVRGGWTIEKIQKQLKNERSSVVVVKELLKYENVDEVLENIYYHGSTTSRESLRAGSVLVEKAARWGREPNFDNFGGGYGETYHSISLSKSKNVASNFTSQSSSGAVTTVLLRKGANVIEMPNIQDSVELEEMLPKLWTDKVDAVKVGDWDNKVSEQELVVLNPNSIAVFREGNHYFQVYQKPRFENLSKNDIIDLIEKRKEKSISSLENKIEKLKSDKKSYLYPTAEEKQLAIERATESIERIKKDVNTFIGNDSIRSNDFRFSIDEIDKHLYRSELYADMVGIETEYEKYYKRYEDVNYEDNDTEFLEYLSELEYNSESTLSEEERISYFEEWQQSNLDSNKEYYENYADQQDLIEITDIELKLVDDIVSKLPTPLEINTSQKSISTYLTFDKSDYQRVVDNLEFKEINTELETIEDTFDVRISNKKTGEFRDSFTGKMRQYAGADIEVQTYDYSGDKRFSIDPEINEKMVFITEQGETKRLSDLYQMTREITKREKMRKRSNFPELYGERSGGSWEKPSKNNNPLLDDFHYYEQASVDNEWLQDKVAHRKKVIDERKAHFIENGFKGTRTSVIDTYAEFDTVMLLDPSWIYTNIVDGICGEQSRMAIDFKQTLNDKRVLAKLKESMETEGFNPREAIFINIDAYGDAYVNEGNHRLLAALELGIPIWATVRYFEMGHTVEGKPFYPDNLVNQAKSMIHRSIIRHELGDIGSKVKSYMELQEQGYDLKFSLDEYNELVAVHNTSIGSLTELLNLGGIPVPSIAIVKDDMVHERFGEVSIIMKPDVVDPKKTPVFSRDAFTTRTPKIAHEVNWKAFNEYLDLIEDRQTRMTVRNFISGVEYSDGTIRLRDVENVGNNIYDLLGEEGFSLYQEYKDDIFGDKLIERPDVEEFNSRTYERNPISKTHAPYSLSNLVKYMKSNGVRGTEVTGSYGNILALYSQRFSDFEDMRSESNKIANEEVSKEQFDLLKDEYFGIITEIAETSPNRKSKDMLTSWGVLNSVEYGIAEALEKNNPTKELVRKTLNKYNNLNATQEQMDKLFDFLERTKDLQEPYFEAKPQRAIKWNEVAKVVAPNGTLTDEIIEQLESNGVEIEFYEEARPNYKNLDPQYKFSLDSEGNQLTPEVESYFKDSQVRDEQGALIPMYHGTPNGDFTIFKSGTYFTSNKEYADVYQSPNASSISVKNGANNPKTFEVYLNIKKPFDTRNKIEKDIFENEFYGVYSRTPLMESGLPDWLEGIDLQEFLEEKGYDYDGLILDEGATGGYGDEVVSRGLAYVVFNPNQVKDVSNQAPTLDPDIRFSLDRKDKFTLEDDYSKVKPVDPKAKLPFTPLEYRDMAYLERKHKFNDPSEFETSFMDKALENFPATHKYKGNVRRTMDEWLSVAERIGQYANEMSEQELKVYAAQTWGYLLPNLRPNNWNKGSGGYVEFKIQQWTNAMFKGAEQVPTKKEPRKPKKVETPVEDFVMPVKQERVISKAVEYHNTYRDGIPKGFDNLTPKEKETFDFIMNRMPFDITGTSAEEQLAAIMGKLELDTETPTEVENVQPQAQNELTEQIVEESEFNQEFRPVVEAMEQESTNEPEEKTRTRQFEKSALEAEILDPVSQKTIEEMIENGEFEYAVKGNNKSINRAYNILNSDGFEKAYNDLMGLFNSGRMVQKEDVVLGEVLIKRAGEIGDSKRAVEMLTTLTILGTELGQAVQAYSMVNKLSPEGQLMVIQKTIERLKRKHLDTRKENIQLELNVELATKFLQAETKEARDVVMDEIKLDIAKQLPVTLMDKLNAWRYLSMLGNPRTHFRNILGNMFFMPMKTMKDVIGLGLETVFIKDTEQKSKSVVSKFNAKDKAIMDVADSDYVNIQQAIESGAKYGTGTEIEMQRSVFNTKWLEKARVLNFDALEFEDQIALKKHYVNTFAQFVKAKQWDANNLSEAQLDIAREYAINEAKRMTFRDASAFASLLNHIERTSKVGAIAKAAIIPFTKTPINIVKRGVEYSPVGLMKNVTIDAYNLKKGNITPTEFIENISRGLTGLGVAAMGAFLVNMGVLNIEDDDDSTKEKTYNNMFGMQRYTIDVFGGTYSIDWLVPLTIPLIMGAEIQNMLSKEENDMSLTDIVYDAASDILEPVFELTMLDGLVQTMKSFDSSSSGFTGEMIQTMIYNYGGQYFPTLAGQIARTIDPVRRTTTPKKTGGLTQNVERFGRSILNKIPFLSTLNEPIVDLRGEEVRQVDNVFGRALLNFVSPGYFNESIATPQDDEIQRLFEVNKDTDILPKITPNYFTSSGEKFILSASERTDFSKTMGETSYSLIEELLNDKMYVNLSDEEQSKMIQDVHKYAYTVAKEGILTSKEKTLDDKWYSKIKQAEQVDLKVTDYLIGSMLYQQTTESTFATRKQNYLTALKNSGYTKQQAIYLMENVAGYVIDDKTQEQLSGLYGMFNFDFKFNFNN